MYTAGGKGEGGGGRGYFLKGQNFLISPAYHTAIFDNRRSWPKEKLITLPPSLDKESKIWAIWLIGAEIDVWNRKLKTKGSQRFTDFCISGVKKVVRDY